MFHRKSNLPARPPIPTKDEIQEDLSLSNADDIVFQTESISSYQNEIRTLEGIDDSFEENTTNLKGPDQAYLKISSFVDKMNHLESCLETLKKEKQNLLKLEESLSSDMAHIQQELKKQSAPS